jgi:hypothetical protein
MSSTFTPSWPFTLTRALLALNVAPAATRPGATDAAPSVAATLAAGLNPILGETREQPSAYAVDDNGRLDIHRPATAIPRRRLVATAAKAS